MKKKKRIYLETSIISHLDAPDRPDREAETLRLWNEIKAGKFEVVLGEPVFLEISDCKTAKRFFMAEEIESIDYERIDKDEVAETLAIEYISRGGLPSRSAVDALHIALATLANCDCVVSWNCKHIVTLRALGAVNEVNRERGLKMMGLLTPESVKGDDDEF
ncbi:hypothetical protein FACS1894139_18130 [Planctomycetales bacterium]|nr:hypothetical protein FACS1894108_15620 [Planctomycetales bacterium]GHT08446.1 hypothetical protein FACS1894139_18130 [Planctomycetales bacterium]GHV23721.1 hypothetical protein AGMMS49959_17710 [Planctomycetales bacterium]